MPNSDNRALALSFHIHAQDGPARRAMLSLPHGNVPTPVFMPVGTVASVKAVPQHLLEELGAPIILGNTYHLYLRPGHERIRALGGLHRFMSWPHPILTDSGGFQVFSLGDLRKVTAEGVEFRSHIDGSAHFFTPERSIEIQLALGADTIMAFDECTEYPADECRARKSLDTTLRWARQSLDYFRAHRHEVPWRAEAQEQILRRSARESDNTEGNHPHHGCHSERSEESVLRLEREQEQILRRSAPQNDNQQPTTDNRQSATENRQPVPTPSLFGIVQGGMYPHLRRESAERLVEMDFDGYAIGGLSVGEPRPLTREIIEATLPHLPADKPRYVMGVGYPDEIIRYAAMGVDMMDCVLPTRAARHNLLFTSQGRMNIRNARFADDQSPPDPECRCLVCRRYSRAYLRHLAVAQEPLSGVLNSLHNLAFYLDTMEAVRNAIEQGTLASLAARAEHLSAHVE